MKALAGIALVVAIISIIVGIISRLTLIPVPPVGIEAHAIFQFANTCLLLAITLLLMSMQKGK